MLLFFLVWWATHSGLSRRVVKQALGLWVFVDTPWYLFLISVPIIGFCFFLILGFFWTLPDHVFGTSRHEVRKTPFIPKLIISFPYGMVRHPAATGFLWLFWALPNYSPNHVLYALCWSVFIVLGTTFEETGIRSDTGDFGPVYEEYRKQVGMFFPLPRWFLRKPVVITEFHKAPKRTQVAPDSADVVADTA